MLTTCTSEGCQRIDIDDNGLCTRHRPAVEESDELTALRNFKNYVHKRLDEAGVATHPDGEHTKHGCRIGDRLDIALHYAANAQPGWEGETGGVKFDQDKPRMDLLDAYAIEELAKVLTFGAKKYAPHNWRKGIVLSRLIAASARHLFAIMRGEDSDPETGLAHAAHLMCCAMFMVWTVKYLPAMDDRWKGATDV